MKKRKGMVMCHCCGLPARDADWKPKMVPVCWRCMRMGGSVERGCTMHHPELYDEYANAKGLFPGRRATGEHDLPWVGAWGVVVE